MKTTLAKLLILNSLLAITACGPGGGGVSTNQSAASSEDGISNTIESALSVAISAFNDVEHVNTLSFKPVKSFFNLAYAASCGMDRFSPSIGTATCSGTESQKTVLSQFSGCTAGISNDYSLSGTMKLTFDTSTTCDSWISGNSPTTGLVTRTTSELKRTNSDSTTISTDSNSHTPYDGSSSIGGGIVTQFSSNYILNGVSVKRKFVSIDGMRRVKKLGTGAVIFEHLIKTSAAIELLGSRSDNLRQASGTVMVYHNTAKYTSSHVMSQLRWISNCCYPTSGSITTTSIGSINGTITSDFGTGTCGDVTITTNGLSKKVTLSACE